LTGFDEIPLIFFPEIACYFDYYSDKKGFLSEKVCGNSYGIRMPFPAISSFPAITHISLGFYRSVPENETKTNSFRKAMNSFRKVMNSFGRVMNSFETKSTYSIRFRRDSQLFENDFEGIHSYLKTIPS